MCRLTKITHLEHLYNRKNFANPLYQLKFVNVKIFFMQFFVNVYSDFPVTKIKIPIVLGGEQLKNKKRYKGSQL